MSRSWQRVASPWPARSTLMTSAPNLANNWVQVGPDCTWVKSRMRTPSNALLIDSYFLLLACTWRSAEKIAPQGKTAPMSGAVHGGIAGRANQIIAFRPFSNCLGSMDGGNLLLVVAELSQHFIGV